MKEEVNGQTKMVLIGIASYVVRGCLLFKQAYFFIFLFFLKESFLIVFFFLIGK